MFTPRALSVIFSPPDKYDEHTYNRHNDPDDPEKKASRKSWYIFQYGERNDKI
jgi:hypothetical protein